MDASQVEFPEIASVEIDNSQKEAFVGDVVEIPFKIEVKEASPSNATKESRFMDMFKKCIRRIPYVSCEQRRHGSQI